MLQPRVHEENRFEMVEEIVNNKTEVGRRRKMATHSGNVYTIGLYAILSLVFLTGLATCQESHIDDEIAADRVKRDIIAGDGDLTTVLLVDNQKLNKDINARNGRYLNVKPVIGLLTSTARTFIQDGVTTEYATEILGTTLDNGRVYAQLLTKSSLVLYDKPVDEDSQKKTRLPFEMDDRNKWNLEQSFGDLDRDHYVIKNTDYVSPKDGLEMFTVFASKPAPGAYATVWNPTPTSETDVTTAEDVTEPQTENSRIQGLQDVPRYSELDALNFLDPLPSARERKISAYKNSNIEIKHDERNNKAINFNSNNKETNSLPSEKTQLKGIEPVKVNPNIKLPTYTVKNEFSPIFYYIDNVESKTEKSNLKPNYLKNAKKLFGHKEEIKPLKTLTYYGFSNFVTVVGDTVIVFAPSTTEPAKEIQEEITPSAKAEVLPNVATKIKTYLSSDLNMVTKTMFGHQLNMETALPTFVMGAQDLGRSSKALINDEESLKDVLYEKPIVEEDQNLNLEDQSSRIIASLKEGLFKPRTQIGLSKDVIQPSEASYSTIQRTHATEKLEINSQTIRDDKTLSITPTEQLVLLKPSTISETVETEEDSTVIDTTTEISPDDEDITENDEVEITTENDYETSPYTEDTLSTPQIEEEEEEEEHKEQVDATCTGGIIPVSTMTTAYKTLTYVTSYFIPLEGTETSTSLKSDVVVTSEIGYLTNLACKSDEIVEISPTATLDVQIEPTKLVGRVVSDGKSEETPQVADVTEASPPVLTTTPKSTEDKNEEVTENTTTEKAQKVEKSETTTLSEKHVEEITQNSLDDKTTVNSSPTEQLVTTSDSHMEMSITTEESTVSIDSRNNIETTTESKEEKESTTENIDEGEIDLIFKTLYTTYTYFTTYFQGSTSTVSSSKAVITNVITSTLDLSEIDPSIFNAIESSDYLFKATQREELGEIQPTSVGVGRPTQTFAINSIIDLVQHRQVIDSVQNDPISNSKISTPELNNEKILEDFKADGVKTFYTTYTFFTTLYVEQDANICSRTEVYTNYVGPSSLIPTKTNEMVTQKTKTNEIDFNNCRKVPAVEATTKAIADKDDDDLDGQLSKPQYHIYTNLDRPNKKNEVELSNYEESNEIVLNNGDSMLVTDVKSSSSKGDHQIIDNSVLDDQVSSESNIEEIMPSPTLLLQTSYTTFTYFTTMYIGKDSSKVKSRLETVTNVVTETLDPKSTEVEETNLPITYYTTFTYWTTLYKDKTTTITSREDIISNVVTPTVQQVTVNPIDTSPIDLATVQIAATNKQGSGDETDIKPSTTVDDLLVDDGKATFFTTYTYFTTFYTGNTSELRSSLETITNIVDNTKDLVENQLGARAVGQKPAPNNLVDTNDEKIVIKATKLTDEIIPTKIGSNVIVATQIVGTYENVLSPPKEPDTEKRIISSQVAIISGDSTIVTNGQNKSEDVTSTTKEDEDLIGTTPGTTVLEGSVTDPTLPPDEEGSEEEDGDSEDGNNSRKKSRLTFSTKKRTYTPIITPFASRNRPTFSPKRVSLTSGAATITRSDFTPTITATPALKVSKASGFGANRKQPNSAFNRNQGGSRRFSRVSTGISATATAQATRGFGRGRSTDIQPSNARRGGFRTASGRPAVAEFSTRGPGSRIRPTLSSRYRGSKQTTTPSLNNEEDSTVTENPLGSTDDAETSTQSLDGNESGFRKTTNPLLRFRRPPLNGRSSVSTTPRTTTQGTTRRGAFNRNRAGATSTTPRSTQRTTQNPLFALRNRQRPNSLFPPRGLINKQPEPQPEEENESDQGENEDTDDLEEESIGEDSDYESSDRQESQVATTTTTVAPRRISNTPSIRPFVGFKRRAKRQADYGSRRSYSNFRRPTARTSKPEPVKEPEPEVVTTPAPRTRKQGRFSSRNSAYQGNSKATARSTATTKAPSSGRQPFILRGDSKTQASSTSRPSFRTRSSRPVKPVKPSSSPAANLRPKVPRLKTFTTAGTEPTRASNRNSARTRTTNRSRSTSRYRTTSNDIVDNNYVNYQIPNDGKLTITHKIPMEVTIPVINGQLTEYKNVLTAKPSIEVLQPNQYSTTKNAFGSQYIVLVSESSEPAENGATKVIQFILHETPTTSIIFTPTTIRGRKTSFSHVIPSTVYDVERVTSTVQPQINANVPLANILLSQLLLGNIGMPQPINPLLALQGQPGVPASPTTEFKTRTTTYVTTVTDAKSTVLPITFRGKEILTTIIDSRVDVITATEFITETVVVTPTPGLPNQNQNQLNSILLLLQQPQFQQQQTTASPLLGLNPDLNLLQNNQQLYNNDLLNSPKPEVLDVKDPEDYLGDYVEEEITPAPKRIQRRKFKTKKVTPPQQQTSVITLYVSGRTPGEFSTVLSTVVVDETQSIQKREAVYFEEFDVNRSDLPNYAEVLMASQSDMMLDNFLMPAMNDMVQNSISHSETQSLESIMGEVSKYMAMDSISSIVETAKSDPTVVYVLKESDVDKMTGS